MRRTSSVPAKACVLPLLLIACFACDQQSAGPSAASPSGSAPAAPAGSPTPTARTPATGPEQARQLLEQSVKHRRQGENASAVKVLRAAVEADPTNSTIHLALGQVLLQRSPEHDAIAAEVSIRKAIEIGYPPPGAQVFTPALPLLWLGRALLEQAKLDEAKKALKEFVDKATIHDDISSADADLRLGIVALQENDVDAAVASLRQAVSLADACVSSALFRSEDLFRQYTTELQIDSKFQLALALVEKQQFADAEQLLRTVLTIKPEHEQGHFQLAKVLQKLGHADDAAREQEIHDLLNQTQDNSSLRAQRDVDEQKRIYDRLKAIYPDYWKSYTRLARSYLQNELHDEAIAECERLLKAAPEVGETSLVRGEAHFLMFRALTAKKEFKNALEHLDQAAALAPGFSEKKEQFKREVEQAMKQVK